MTNSNYSVSNRLFAYIAHGIDINEQIKTNYASSLIFIGDEGQIYSPINNTYIGIGQTAYTNLLAYTNYINERIDALSKLMASSLVSKIYAQYDDYDMYRIAGGDADKYEEVVNAMSGFDKDFTSKTDGTSWRADYATTYVTLKGTADYNPKTGLAYTTYNVLGTHTLSDDEVSYYNATYAGGTSKYKTGDIVDWEYTYTVSGVNSGFGTSGITITLEKDPSSAKPNTDSDGNTTYTYMRNIIRIDDSLTWSYIANAYTYSIGFAKEWATTEANRVYRNLIGEQTGTYVPVSWDYVANNSISGAEITIPSEAINSYWTAYNANQYEAGVKGKIYAMMVFPTYADAVDALGDASKVQMTPDGQFYGYVAYNDLNLTEPAAPGTTLTVGGKEGVVADYYVKDSQYNSTYNTNISDGLQTLKEVAYILDVITDGFGTIEKYTVLSYDKVGALTADLDASFKNKVTEVSANVGTSGSCTVNSKSFGTSFAEDKDVAQANVVDVLAYMFGDNCTYYLAKSDFDYFLNIYQTAYGEPTYAVIKYTEFVSDTTTSTSTVGTHDIYSNADLNAGTITAKYEHDATNICEAHLTRPAYEGSGAITDADIVGHKLYWYDADAAIVTAIADSNAISKSENGNWWVYTIKTVADRETSGAVFDNNTKKYYTSKDYDIYRVIEERTTIYTDAAEYTALAKVERNTENIGIKMTYTIAKNQEQINDLSDRINVINSGAYNLHSINTVGGTYVSLTTVSNQEKININGASANVGDVTVDVKLNFGSTYTTEAKDNIVFVPVAYTDIDAEDNVGNYRYGFTAVAKANVNYADVSYYWVVAPTGIGYVMATTDDVTKAMNNDTFVVYRSANDSDIPGNDIITKHTVEGTTGYKSWANDNTTYFIKTDRGNSPVTHVDLNSDGLTYTSWVTSYIADTYTLVNNAMINMKADTVNLQKGLLDELDFHQVARTSEMISYAYQWNGKIGTASRELPTDELHSNVEIWGEKSSTVHNHEFSAVDDATSIITDGSKQYFRRDGVEYVALDANNYKATWYTGLADVADTAHLYYFDADGTEHEILSTNIDAAWEDKAQYLRAITTFNSADMVEWNALGTNQLPKYEDGSSYTYTWGGNQESNPKASQYKVAPDESYHGAFESLNPVVDEFGYANVAHEYFVQLYYKVYRYVEVPVETIEVNVQATSLMQYTITYAWTNKAVSPAITYTNRINRGWKLVADNNGTTEIKYYTATGALKDDDVNKSTITLDNDKKVVIKLSNTTVAVDGTWTTANPIDAIATRDTDGLLYTYVGTDTSLDDVLKTPEGKVQPTLGIGSNNTYVNFKLGHGVAWYPSIAYGEAANEISLTRYLVEEVDCGTVSTSSPAVKEGETSKNMIALETYSSPTKITDASYFFVGFDGDNYVYGKYEGVQLYTRCDDYKLDSDSEKSTKYIDTSFVHKTWKDAGHGENVMQVTTYITKLEDATEDNTGLADAHDVRSFIDNVIEWVDLSASVTTSIKDANPALYGGTFYNPLNTAATSYNTSNAIRVRPFIPAN